MPPYDDPFPGGSAGAGEAPDASTLTPWYGDYPPILRPGAKPTGWMGTVGAGGIPMYDPRDFLYHPPTSEQMQPAQAPDAYRLPEPLSSVGGPEGLSSFFTQLLLNHMWNNFQGNTIIPQTGAAPYWYVDPRAQATPGPAYQAAPTQEDEITKAYRSREEVSGFSPQAFDEQSFPGSPQTPQELNDYFNTMDYLSARGFSF